MASDLLSTFRTWLRPLTTPLTIDDYTGQLNNLWSAREMRGEIQSITQLTPETAQLTIRTGWQVPTRFTPGQHIGLGVQINGRWTWRSYSLIGAPTRARSGVLHIAVRQVPGGRVSTHVHQLLQPGTQVRLSAPEGNFTLPSPVPER